MHKNAQHTADESMTLGALFRFPARSGSTAQEALGSPLDSLLALFGQSWALLGLLVTLLDFLSLILAFLASAWQFLLLFWSSGIEFHRSLGVFGVHLFSSAPSGLAEKPEVFSISRLDASSAALGSLLGASWGSPWGGLGSLLGSF